MGAIVNGLNLHGLKAFGSTFFTFSDYMKGAIRLQRDPAPARDPRLHPRLDRARRGRADPSADRAARAPARHAEPLHGATGRGQRDRAGLALRARADRAAPVAFALSRQGLPVWNPSAIPDDAIHRGAYVLRHSFREGEPDVILIGTGLGGAHLHGGRRPARGGGDRHARRLRAVPGALRRAGRRLPRQRAPAERARARVGGGGLDVRLERVDHRGRRLRRHDDVRRLRSRRRTCTSTSASRRRTWPPAPGRSSSDWRATDMSVGAKVNQRLAALTAAGTSVWLDQIRRSLITGGELERLVEEDSLRGVTSNPAIFEKAILGSSDYDEQLAELAERGARRPRHLRADRDHGRAARLRRPAPGLGRARRRRRVRVARGRAGLRARHRRHARPGARPLAARGPPQPDDQDPRDRRGRARRSSRRSRPAST